MSCWPLRGATSALSMATSGAFALHVPSAEKGAPWIRGAHALVRSALEPGWSVVTRARRKGGSGVGRLNLLHALAEVVVIGQDLAAHARAARRRGVALHGGRRDVVDSAAHRQRRTFQPSHALRFEAVHHDCVWRAAAPRVPQLFGRRPVPVGRKGVRCGGRQEGERAGRAREGDPRGGRDDRVADHVHVEKGARGHGGAAHVVGREEKELREVDGICRVERRLGKIHELPERRRLPKESHPFLRCDERRTDVVERLFELLATRVRRARQPRGGHRRERSRGLLPRRDVATDGRRRVDVAGAVRVDRVGGAVDLHVDRVGHARWDRNAEASVGEGSCASLLAGSVVGDHHGHPRTKLGRGQARDFDLGRVEQVVDDPPQAELFPRALRRRTGGCRRSRRRRHRDDEWPEDLPEHGGGRERRTDGDMGEASAAGDGRRRDERGIDGALHLREETAERAA